MILLLFMTVTLMTLFPVLLVYYLSPLNFKRSSSVRSRALYDDLIATLPPATSPKRIPILYSRVLSGELVKCHDCLSYRSPSHQCLAHKPAPSYDAWLGDALLTLLVRLLLRRVDSDYASLVCSNRSLAEFVRSYYPEWVIPHDGVQPSDHALGTILEAAFWRNPFLLPRYLLYHFKSLYPSIFDSDFSSCPPSPSLSPNEL